MNATYFVLISALLAFATGFFVAAIIWIIRWFLTPRDPRTSGPGFMKKFLKHDLASKDDGKTGTINDESNKELYQYYHGKN